MKHIFIKRILGAMLPVMALASLLSGCAEEADMPVGDSGNGSGTFVVDYSVDEVLARSVSHSPLPAHERIKSLTYLLYDDNGALVKMREIPHIDSMTDGDWPMKRATMTWEQREALKDTLTQGHNYTAVFVANANPDLFGGEVVLHNSKTVDGHAVDARLEELYLSLPRSVAFNDHNMFYLCVRQIEPGAAVDRDHPLDCPVHLQRIVSRTDFYSDDYPEWDTDFTRDEIRKFSDKLYDKYIPQVKSGKNHLHVNDMLKQFTSDFYDWSNKTGAILIPDYPIWIAAFAAEVNNLDCSKYINGMNEYDVSAIKDEMYNACRNNPVLRDSWRPWKGLNAKVAYNACADRFYLGTRSSGSDAAAAMNVGPLLDIIGMTPAEGETAQLGFTLIGFGENPGTTAGNEQNRMKEILLFDKNDPENHISAIPLPANMASFAEQGGNERIGLNYRPIKTLKYNEGSSAGKTYRLTPVNLRESISNSQFASSVYVGQLQKFFESEAGKIYGTGLEEFVIEITIPDLSDANALIVEPEWTLK